MEKDIEINSWEELQRELFRDTWNDKLHRFQSPFIYRGLSSKRYDLKTNMARLGGNYANLEPHLLRNFRKYAHSNTWPGTSFWNWLAVAQHHGLPTRLLDWTLSPFVALYFATANLENYNEDGVIWCVNNLESNKCLPEKLREVIAAEGSNVFTPGLLELVYASLKDLGTLQQEDFVLFPEPPSLDERIVHQFALFSIMSRAEAERDSWLNRFPHLYFRIIIPARLKWEIRDKLDQANITERVLFPGLNGFSARLKRQYTTAPDPHPYLAGPSLPENGRTTLEKTLANPDSLTPIS